VLNYNGMHFDFFAHDPLMRADIFLAPILSAPRNPHWFSFFYALTLTAASVTATLLAIIVSAILWRKQERLMVFGLWLALTLSEGFTFFAKLFFHRPRPLFAAVAEHSFSFPSGHATTVVVLYGFFLYLFLRRAASRAAKISAIIGTVALIILVDFSRLYLGVHYLSDVLAGNVVGAAGLFLGTYMMRHLNTSRL